jgi:hypothetical protein
VCKAEPARREEDSPATPGGPDAWPTSSSSDALARARVDDLEDHEKNPKDPWLEVEDVMAITLEKNHIKLPDSFFTVMKDFKPKHEPEKKKN